MSSSIAVGSSARSARSRCSWTGCASRASSPLPLTLTVASWPGVEQQDAGGDQLVLGQPVALGVAHLHQVGEQVVARVRAPLGGQVAQVGDELGGGVLGGRLDRRRPAVLVHLHDRVGPRAAAAGGRRRARPSSSAMTSTGSCSAIPESTSTGSAPSEPLHQAVDQPAGELLDPRPQPLHVPAGERRADQPAQPGVVRRLHLEDRVAVDQVEALELLGRLLVAPDAAQPAVAEDGVGLGVREGEPQPQALVPLHRRRRAGPRRTTGRDRRRRRGRSGPAESRERGRAERPSPRQSCDSMPGQLGRDGAACAVPSHIRCRAWPPASEPPPLPPRRRASTRRRRARAAPAAGTSTATGRATRRRSTRPFEGLPGETDWVAMRELVPAATATMRTTDGRDVTLASVLPGGTPALVRANGEILLGVQLQTSSDDVSRDIGTALAAALESPVGTPVDPGPVGAAGSAGPRLQELLDLGRAVRRRRPRRLRLLAGGHRRRAPRRWPASSTRTRRSCRPCG